MAMRKNTAAFLFLFATFLLPAEEWYKTAPGGIPGAPLRRGPGSDGWTLSISREGEREVRNLYEDGALRSVIVLIRSEGRLVAREESDAEGNLLSRVEYAWDAEGNPRAVYIAMEDGGVDSVETDAKATADGAVWRHSSSSGGDWTVTDMDEEGRPVERLALSGGVVTEETSWKRTDEGELSERIESRGDEVKRSLYDAGGRLVEESTKRGGTVVLTRSYRWDGDDLVRVEERGEGRLAVREISWSGGRIVGETKSVDGVKVSEVEWTSPDERIETLYRDGEPVVRIHWREGIRVREEFLRDGAIVRIRDDFR